MVVAQQFGQEVEEDLFAAALSLPAPERETYLQRACDGNIELLSRLTALIDAFADANGFISDRLTDGLDGTSQIGAYRLLQELGEGGCGVAYLAEQATPVRRQVALKVIKPGMDTKAVIARFEAERQVLALLDHPSISKVFDASTTPEGRPYFVMELVRGIRITEFCIQSHMTIPQRLSLFIQVCQAIQHAHQKGIIHRDIKPSNVLVTMHDGLPLAKVIDFGIAKAMQGGLIDQTLHTEVDQIMGTPAYISPEQTRLAQTAVDTRSDIYSLGVLLYQLLTGNTPFDAHELDKMGIERLRERICSEEPPRPSHRLTSLDVAALRRIAIGCAATPSKLINQVRDDLDWIVMQCLEKEPARRYQTVNDLIADLERYLHHEPVFAHPPAFIYTVRKLARRNRIVFASAIVSTVFVISITTFAILMALQSERIATERDQAERERQRAQKVSNVALSVFGIADPFQTFGHDVSGPALLERAATSIRRELADQPEARARLLQAVGVAYIRRGQFKPAIDYLRDTVQVLRQTQGAENEALKALVDLSLALRMNGDLQEAWQALADAEQLAQRFGLQQSSAYARLLLNRGRIHVDESRVLDAEADMEASLRLYRKVIGPRSIEVAEVLGDLSTVLNWTDNHALAERAARESIQIFDVTAPPMYPDRVRIELNLAEALYLQNRLDEAASMLVIALEKNTELFGHNSAEVADALDRLAVVRYSQGRFDQAEMCSRDAVAIGGMVSGKRHLVTASMATTLGRTLAAQGKYSEAEMTLREALQVFSATLPADHQYIASAEYLLGEVLLSSKRPSDAEAVLASSMNRWTRAGAPPWRAMRSASALGEALYRLGHTLEAEKYLTESFRELSTDTAADADAKVKARERFARYVRQSSKTATVATQ